MEAIKISLENINNLSLPSKLVLIFLGIISEEKEFNLLAVELIAGNYEKIMKILDMAKVCLEKNS